MRTFTRPIPVTAAIQWLENGRENLYALVDVQNNMAMKVGSLTAVETMLKSKRNRPWRIMSYQDIKAFHKAGAPKPTPMPAPVDPEANPFAVPPKATAAPTVPARPAHSGATGPAMEELTKVSEQLIESIVNERIKEAVEQYSTTRQGDPVPTQALGLIQQVRKLEKHGMSVISELEKFNKHNPMWSKAGAVSFQQATMALIKSLTTSNNSV